MRPIVPGRFHGASISTPAGELEVRLSDGGNWQLKVRGEGEFEWRLLCTGCLDGSVFTPPREDDRAPIRLGPLTIDLAARRAHVEGVAASLTPREFDLLAALAQEPGRLFTKKQLLSAIWGHPRRRLQPYAREPREPCALQTASHRSRRLHSRLPRPRLPALGGRRADSFRRPVPGLSRARTQLGGGELLRLASHPEMALRPPDDFTLASSERARPSDAQLRALWDRQEAARGARERTAAWRLAQARLRRDAVGGLRQADSLPTYVRERLAFGPDARAALRPMPRQNRVFAAGVDTWSPCWYAEPGSPLACTMWALASEQAPRAWLLPEPIGAHRIGWFPEHGLVFAEGRPGGENLLPAAEIAAALRRLCTSLGDLGIPLAASRCAGLRRLDVAVDLHTHAVEGLALLECIASASFGAGKLAAYRAERRTESVLVKTRAGRTLARVYDKGAERSAIPRGRWLRFEAQWRFPRAERPAPEQLDGPALRARFARRFEPLWQATGGLRLAPGAGLAERIGEAVADGRLAPSRARTLAGYLLLGAVGVPQGARRTTCELERECRELGLTASLSADTDHHFDVATVLDECLAPQVWGAQGEISSAPGR